MNRDLCIAVLAFVGAALLPGCASTMQVRVLTEPPFEEARAVVSSIDAEQKSATIKMLDSLPGMVSLTGDSTAYGFDVEGAGFRASQLVLSRAEIDSLPLVDGAREVKIPVQREFSKEIRYNVVWDSKTSEFVALQEPVRAYKVIEDSGGSPSLVMSLPENCGIQGMSLSPDGQKLIYAKATPKLAQVSDRDGAVGGSTSRKLVPLEACNLEMISLLDGKGQKIQGGTEQVTRDAFRDVDPSFAENGKYIRFASNRLRRQSADMVQLRATGQEGGLQVLYEGRGDTTVLRPSTAVDGTTAFAMQTPGPGGLTEGNIHVWVKGGPDHPFPTEVAVGTDPQISPDGKRIVYIDAKKNLCVVNSDASTPTVLQGSAMEIERSYRASLFDEIKTRFGDKLVDELVRRYGTELATQISGKYGNDLANAEPRARMDEWLYEGFSYDARLFRPYSRPTWSPDGRHIVFTSMQGADATGRPNENIWMIPGDGGSPSQLTSNGSVDTNPLVSPDGQVYFLSNRGQAWGIWAMKSKPELALHP